MPGYHGKMRSFRGGGYTGAGMDGVVQPGAPAGMVHEGEFVIPAGGLAEVLARGAQPGPGMLPPAPSMMMGKPAGGLAEVMAAGRRMPRGM